MTNDQPPSRSDWPDWARAHKACFDVQPLIEMHKGEKVQVGFELRLYAQMPPRGQGVDERGARILGTLREMLQSVVGPDHPVARLEIAWPSAARVRPETGMTPEVELLARIVRRSGTFEPVPQDARQNLAFLEEGLIALGMKRGG